MILYQRFELPESIEDFILGIYKYNPCPPRIIINKGYVILETTQIWNWHRSTHILMYKVQDLLGSIFTAWKSSLGILS
jgi:hypothetical protein